MNRLWKRYALPAAAAAVLTVSLGLEATPMAAAATEAKQEAPRLLTQESASAQAGFPVKLPSYLPAGYYLSDLVYVKDIGQVIGTYLRNAGGRPAYLRIKKGEIAKEATGLTEVTITKGKAYAGKRPQEYGDMNLLLWEEDKGIVYQWASGLAVDELKKMAESVGVGTPPTPPDQYEIESDTKDMTAEEAKEWLGSPIPLPTKQPLGVVISYHYYKSGEEESVTVNFKSPTNQEDRYFIDIMKGDIQEKVGEVPLIDGKNTVREIKLANGMTAYACQYKAWSAQDPNLTALQVLFWEPSKGVIYKTFGPKPIEEYVKIAESMK